MNFTSPDTAGQYVQPLDRSSFYAAPVVSGYATVRMAALLPNYGSLYADVGQPDPTLRVRLEGGTAAATLTFVTSNDYSLPYASKTVVDTITLAAGGVVTRNFGVDKKYLELWCTAGGPSQVRFQVSAGLPLGILPFAKDDAAYPQFINQPTAY